MLACEMRVWSAGRELRTCGLQRDLVETTLVIVEGAIEAVELVGREGISGAARFDVGQAAVVLVLVGLECTEEIVERVIELGAALGFEHRCRCGHEEVVLQMECVERR